MNSTKRGNIEQAMYVFHNMYNIRSALFLLYYLHCIACIVCKKCIEVVGWTLEPEGHQFDGKTVK